MTEDTKIRGGEGDSGENMGTFGRQQQQQQVFLCRDYSVSPPVWHDPWVWSARGYSSTPCSSSKRKDERKQPDLSALTLGRS